MRVGFVGPGSQGGPMARRIAEAGFPTILWARRPSQLEPFEDTAATFASTPAELGAASDALCICVVDDAGVDDERCRPIIESFGDPILPTGLIDSTLLDAADAALVRMGVSRHLAG